MCAHVLQVLELDIYILMEALSLEKLSKSYDYSKIHQVPLPASKATGETGRSDLCEQTKDTI